MANIIDYLKWRGDISFKKNSFNEVDSLILSQLAYMDIISFYKGITINKAINDYLNKYSEEEIIRKYPFTKNFYSFLKNLQTSSRFSNIRIIDYVNKVEERLEKQFSAMIFKLNFNTILIVFRGTDSSIVGWKEDLNMTYMSSIPSQKEALDLVNKKSHFYRNIYLMGHSKGGNLATFAGVRAKKSIQKRIKKIYNFDGPGFNLDFIDSLSYQKMLPKIESFVPKTSIVGMLLFHKCTHKVIKSSEEIIYQHNPLSWEVLNNHFILLDKIDDTSEKISLTLVSWLDKITPKEREIFASSVYKILNENNIKTINDLANLKMRNIVSILKTFTKLDKDSKEKVLVILKTLIYEANKSFGKKTIFSNIKSIAKKRIN